jgi:hypothetical protein
LKLISIKKYFLGVFYDEISDATIIAAKNRLDAGSVFQETLEYLTALVNGTTKAVRSHFIKILQ